MEPGEIFDDEFNFSAQVHRVFESVENVSDIMKKHLETVKKDKELERVRNEIKATKVESLQTELRMLVAENQALKEKENQSKLNTDSLKRTNERLKREVSLLKLELEGKKSTPKKAKKVLRAKPKDAASKTPSTNRECGLKSRKNVFKAKIAKAFSTGEQRKSETTTNPPETETNELNVSPSKVKIKEEILQKSEKTKVETKTNELDVSPFKVKIKEETLLDGAKDEIKMERKVTKFMANAKIAEVFSTGEQQKLETTKETETNELNVSASKVKIKEEILLDEVRDEIKMEISDDNFSN